MDHRYLSPMRLTPNRVYRFYRGGALLEAFRGVHDPADDFYPEDWVGSVTEAANPAAHGSADEGLSAVTVGGQVALIRDLVRESAVDVAGRDVVQRYGSTTGVLVKLLDASQRLPVHCHPTREFARRILGSPFGKAEAWIVLATRQVPGAEPPNVRLGFRREMSRDELSAIIAGQDRTALLENLVTIPVKAGDAVMVTPGLPHAIGAGVFVLEVQEPTDFSVLAEWDGYPIDPEDAHLGRGWETMLDCFDRRAMTGDRLTELTAPPSPIVERPGMTMRLPLGPASDPFFGALACEIRGTADWPLPGVFAVGVVTGGRGRIRNRHGDLDLASGDTFTLFAAAPPTVLEGSLDMIACTPPGGVAPLRS